MRAKRGYHKRANNQAGFTLVEVLIAMFIFSLITAGSMSALSSALAGKAALSQRVSDMTDVEMARILIKSDLSNLVLVPKRDAFGGTEPNIVSGGFENLLDFTRAGRQNPGGLEARGDLERVVYIFEDGRFIRRALGQVFPAPDTAVRERVLLSGLLSCDIRFHYGDQRRDVLELAAIAPSDGGAQPSVQAEALPDYIAVEFVFSNGDEMVQYFEFSS